MKTKEVVIVGAGPGGLAAGMLLAQAGCKVTLLERNDRPGGRTSPLGDSKYTFDLGPTFFLYPRILQEIFQACGYNLFKEVPMKRLDPQYRIQFESGVRLDATPDPALMKEQIAAINPADADGFDHFIRENRSKLAAFQPILEQPFNSWKDVMKPSLLKVLPMLNPHQPIESYLKRFFSDPRVRIAFCFQSKYLGMSPYQCPSLFSILSFLEYEFGVYHPIGGCNSVTQAMARIATDMGVDIKYNEPVESFEYSGSRPVRAVTASGSYKGDAFVVNADFAQFMSKTVPNNRRSRWTDEKLRKKKYSCSTYMMYLGVKREFDLPHHTIFISDDYQKNLSDIEKDFVIPENPSFYVQNACVTDPSLAPEGRSALYMLAPVSHMHGSIDWNQQKQAFRDKFLQRVRLAGYDINPQDIEFEKVMTPANWQNDHQIYRGATFNLAHGLDQMLHLRPRNRFEDIERVYLVGGGTHPGSGLPVIFESARITTNLLLDDLGLERIRQPVESRNVGNGESLDLIPA